MVPRVTGNAGPSMTYPRMTARALDPTVAPFKSRIHLYFQDDSLDSSSYPQSRFEDLPDHLLILIFEELATLDLQAVAGSSRRLREIVLGFSVHDRIRELLSFSSGSGSRINTILYKTVRPEFESLSLLSRLLRLEAVYKNQEKRYFSIVQEASWHHKAMPVLKADPYKMVLAAGNELWTSFEGSEWTISRLARPGIGDISDIALTGVMDEVLISFVDGRIERVKIGPESRNGQAYRVLKRHRSESQNAVEAIDYLPNSDAILSVYQHGQMIVNWSNIKIGSRPWCTRFIGSGKRIATGTRAQSPLLIHEVSPTELRLARSYSISENRSSVFAVESISEDLVLSGWYDGCTYMHDLRISSPEPVSSWRNPYEDAAVYSLAHSGNNLYSGSALNGTVRIFDLRQPKLGSGISLFLGAKEKGPVYSLVAEHERVFGALETGVRGLDFYRTNPNQSSRDDWIGDAAGGCKLRERNSTTKFADWPRLCCSYSPEDASQPPGTYMRYLTYDTEE